MLRHRTVLALALFLSAFAVHAREQAPALTDARIEEFLKKARVVSTKSTSKGVTGSLRAVLSDGTLTHDAHIQTVDEFKQRFEGRDQVEFNFRDNFRFNIAAYRIDRLLGLELVPVSVERAWRGQEAAFTWWVDDVMMDEGDRLKKGVQAPDPKCWADQLRRMRLFDQLIDNIDRNQGNMLISKDWRLWGIDHTRAFRYSKTPRKPEHLTRIERDVLARLKALEFRALKRDIGRLVSDADIRNLLARRDGMVKYYDTHGEAAFFDRTSAAKGCGVGTEHAQAAAVYAVR